MDTALDAFHGSRLTSVPRRTLRLFRAEGHVLPRTSDSLQVPRRLACRQRISPCNGSPTALITHGFRIRGGNLPEGRILIATHGMSAAKWLQTWLRSGIAALLLVAPPAVAQQSSTPHSISWSTIGKQFRESTGPVLLSCPPLTRFGEVWGTDLYTDDSSVCTAAAHAGHIDPEAGGVFALRMKPGQQTYAGSRRNGVVSAAWGQWDFSFSIERAPPRPDFEAPIVTEFAETRSDPDAPAEPGGEVISWSYTAARLAPNGRRFTFRCMEGGISERVSGVDLYSWDSSIFTAAVHAGVITLPEGGVVTIEMRPGRPSYRSVMRNGVMSVQAGRTTLGFVVIEQPPAGPNQGATAAVVSPGEESLAALQPRVAK